jgi:hypothetical protein
LEQELIPINIGNVNDGAVIDAFEIELRKVMANIQDLSTPATATRAITLTIAFKPYEDRITIETEFQSTVKLAAIEKNVAKMFVGKSEDGKLVAFASDPRQMKLWSAPAPKEVPPVISFGGAKQ